MAYRKLLGKSQNDIIPTIVGMSVMPEMIENPRADPCRSVCDGGYHSTLVNPGIATG
jgi:hypothetical protein